MLASNRLMNDLDRVIDRAYLGFTFLLIGEQFLTDEQKIMANALGLIVGQRPLLELLYVLVRQRSTPGYRKDLTLAQLLNQISETGVLPVINDTQQFSIDHAKVQIQEALEETKRALKKKVKQAVLSANNEYKHELSVARLGNLSELADKRTKATDKLVAAIGLLSASINTEFDRAFTTALTNFVNNAVVDEATTGRQPSVVQVYKTVINDADLCPYCAKFYRNKDGSPKIYSLAELQANGTNEGRAKSEWKPTIGPTHPRCRCELQYV